MNLLQLEEQIKSGYKLNAEEALKLSEYPDKEALYSLADRIRKHFCGDKFDTCSILNARSGRCSEDCKWCAQSKHYKTDIDIYSLIGVDKALDAAKYNSDKKVGRFSLVTSGRTMNSDEVSEACKIYSEIALKLPIHLCASMGLLEKSELTALKRVGVEHYHCNIETAPSFFGTLCSTHSFEDKRKTIESAKKVGLKICSGGIIGMGENIEQRIEMAIALREIGADSIPLNILNPIPGTPLEGTAPLSDEEILTTFAIFRLINPNAMIRFAGGRLRIAHIQEKAMHAGINAALVGDLLTTIGSDIDSDMALIEKWQNS